MKNSIAICPGSFDPITLGHLDIISRGSAMFDKVIVVVMSNVHKNNGSFSVEERVEMIKKSVAHLPNIEVDYFDGLLADYAAKKNAKAIIKGLRAMSDFEYEFQMALMNHKLEKNIETLFMMTSGKYSYLSSILNLLRSKILLAS